MKKLLVIFPLIILFITGCNSESTNPANEKASFKLYMVDSPAMFDAVNIVVTRVEVHKGIEEDDTTGGSGWYVINNIPHTYNLLELRNGTKVVLGDTLLPPGHYSQVRLIIGEGSNVVVNGVPFPLIIPSGPQTGVKLINGFDLEGGSQYAFTLDFNVSSSIIVTGNGKYKLKPTIRMMEDEVSGSISGQILPEDAHAYIWTKAGYDTVSTTADDQGYFKLMALPSDEFTLYVESRNTAYNDTVLTGIEIEDRQNKDIGIITLSTK